MQAGLHLNMLRLDQERLVGPVAGEGPAGMGTPPSPEPARESSRRMPKELHASNSRGSRFNSGSRMRYAR
jgi:hypothetical protein